MNQAEREAKEEENLQGVHDEYLRGIVKNLKAEIKASGQPSCYKRGTFWINPKDPLFALHSTKNNLGGCSPAGLYHLPVFVWLPYCLPDRPDCFRCTRCNRHNLVRDGICRRIRDMHNDYFLLTARFVCNKNTADPGCGASYQGTDPDILAQLPRHVQEAFPAYLTARGAIDKNLMAVMRTLFAGRFGPKPFASLLGEMRHLHHAHRELTYLATCVSSPSPTAPIPFSTFEDKSRYAGTHPSYQWCNSIFVDWMRAHRVFYDRVMASLPGGILKGDHTFKVIKYMARLSGEPTHDAMYTVVNEWEDARAQAFTLTKSLSYVSEMYEDIADGLEAHGCPPTSFMYTDNASASGELAFHESTTRSMTKNVVHKELDPYQKLPPLSIPPEIRVVLYDSPDLIDSACGNILDSILDDGSRLVIGFDIEYEVETTGQGGPGANPRARTGQLDVIQIAMEGAVYVFKVTQFKSPASVPPCLRSILISDQIIKTGRAVRTDLKRVAEAWSIPELHASLQESDNSLIDLGSLAKLKGKVSDASSGLAALSAIILQKRISKLDSIRCSRWSLPQLTDSQRDYAALDAYASWSIWKKLSSLPSVGLHLDKNVPGQLLVALGSLVSSPPTISIPPLGSKPAQKINVTASRALILIETVVVPGFIASLYHETLETLSKELKPFHLVVTRSTLRTRAIVPPTSTEPINPTIRFYSEEHLPIFGSLARESDSDDDSDSESDSSDCDEENLPGLLNFELQTTSVVPSPEAGADDEYDFDDSIDDLIRNVDLTSLENSSSAEPRRKSPVHMNPTDSACANTLHQPQSASGPLSSRLFDDLWHVQDRLLRLLSKGHSGFKAFAAAFSQVLLVPDDSDVAAVSSVYQKRGLTWSYALRSESDAIRRRVRRYCPPPERLVPDLKKLFDGWSGVKCSVDPQRGVLFSEAATKQSAAIIRVAEQGLLSDPPGFPLYRAIGTDPDGLTVYRCLRGTNSIEGGIHMPLRRTFGSLRASPELADSLLANIRHRRNATVGWFNRTGKRYRNHFDTWRTDEIVELATQLDIKPSFPLPAILGTRIATKESSGIIKVPKSMTSSYGMHRIENTVQEGTPYYRDVPVHLLTHLSTAPVSVYEYLRQRQQTAHAVVPIHTSTEYRLFNELLGTYEFAIQSSRAPVASQTAKAINFEKFAIRWNQVVHERPNDNLYYKIPQQLERHHKVWAAYRAEKATMSNSIQARKAITDVLNDPNRRSRVLPALTLPGPDSTPTLQDRKGKMRDDRNIASTARSRINASTTHHTSPPTEIQPAQHTQVGTESVSTRSETPVTIPAPPVTTRIDPASTFLPAAPSNDPGPSSVTLSSRNPNPPAAPGKRRVKRCAACRDHDCARVDSCKGSGGSKFCACLDHDGPARPRKRVKA
ncbi:hypothetical protein FPV67DRAFT_1559024 [Lyophyllum atratum]|nr:hypothetical protein FPV67DRAFT_1559024 [Lyophyllum atratum]